MGQYWVRPNFTDRSTAPDFEVVPSYDSHLGFDKQRKERVFPITREEQYAAKLNPDKADYCADKLIKMMACKSKYMPMGSTFCTHQQHEYDECKYQDHVLRMKEYEREFRLNKRAERIAKREARQAHLESE